MKLSISDFTTPKLPELTSAKKQKSSPRGLSSVKTSFQQLFRKYPKNTKLVSLTPYQKLKKTLSYFWQKNEEIPPSKRPLKSVENKTEVYSFQPSRKYLESVSQTKAAEKFFTPEYLLRATPKEIYVPLKGENRQRLFANLNLDLIGTLCKREDGLYYLRLMEKLYAHLTEVFAHDEYMLPDFDFRLGPSVMAILPYEKPFGPILEVGKEFSFTIKRALFVNQYDWPGVEKTLILTLTSKQLAEFRVAHGLSEKPNGRDFHLTLGIKRTAKPFEEKAYMRVHVGHHPV